MFEIFVDSAANIPAELVKAFKIKVLSFVNLVNGKEMTCFDPDLTPEEERQKGKDYYDVIIHRCLWYTACVENECPELCRLFCDVDDISYGGLKKIGFSRTKTLGYGGDCCDFHFKKCNKREKHKDNSCDTFSDSLVEELSD